MWLYGRGGGLYGLGTTAGCLKKGSSLPWQSPTSLGRTPVSLTNPWLIRKVQQGWLKSNGRRRGVRLAGLYRLSGLLVGMSSKLRLRGRLGLLLPPSHLRTCTAKLRQLVPRLRPSTRGGPVKLLLRHRRRRPYSIAAGLSKCAASFLSAAPVVRAFAIGEGTFTRSLQRLFEVQRHRPCADPPGARVKGFLRRRTGCT